MSRDGLAVWISRVRYPDHKAGRHRYWNVSREELRVIRAERRAEREYRSGARRRPPL